MVLLLHYGGQLALSLCCTVKPFLSLSSVVSWLLFLANCLCLMAWVPHLLMQG